MCGIFAYQGKGASLSSLLQGLQKLEYRGYDSCGVIAYEPNNTLFRKNSGKIGKLKEKLTPNLRKIYSSALLHTRWATHGRPTQLNAHPHKSSEHSIYIVHNGIIENYLELKQKLKKKGFSFRSDTDSEVVANLIASFYHGSLEDAVFDSVEELKGNFALGIFSEAEPETIIGVRHKSPLLIGVSEQGSFLASDVSAVAPWSREVIYLKEKQVTLLKGQRVDIYNFKRKKQKVKKEALEVKAEEISKKGFKHFMLKEIHQQPQVLSATLSFYVKNNKINFKNLNLSQEYLRKVKNIFITGCGTAYHAAYVAKYFLEKHTKVRIEVDTSSEFRYRNFNVTQKDLFIAISQSGETADTLAAVRKAQKNKAKVLSICNVASSTLARTSDSFIYTPAGPEVGVASTKAYTAQLMCLYLFSLHLADLKKNISGTKKNKLLKELFEIPGYCRKIISQSEEVAKIAKQFSKFGCFLFLGRGINFPTALEGALKLKEISYIPAEGYPAGEMKHGPIALIDEYRAVVCIAPEDALHEKMISSLQEIKARKGKILAIVNTGDQDLASFVDQVVFVPKLKFQEFSPFLAIVVLQIFAYSVAKNLGREIDQPRNLAKSVTVE